MSSPWIVILAILALAVLYVLLPRAAHVFGRYRRARLLTCPDTGEPAEVTIDAPRAALSSLVAEPRLRAAGCSLWLARSGCVRRCLRLLQQQGG